MDDKKIKRKGLLNILLMFSLLSGLTLLGETLGVDRAVIAKFYTGTDGFYLDKTYPWLWFYKYGTIPGLFLTIFSLGAWFFCFVKPAYRANHKYFLLIVLTAVLGAGLITNALLKNYWGRPRPDQTIAFGGNWEYREITSPGTPGKGASFPCGHCTMGFMFVTLFVFRKKYPVIGWGGLLFGLTYGGLVAVTRVIQGAHFPLDALWSLGIIVLTSITLYYFVLKIPLNDQSFVSTMTGVQKKALGAVIIIAMILMAAAFLTRRPYYTSYVKEFKVPATVNKLVLTVNQDLEIAKKQWGDTNVVGLHLHARGFGFPSVKHKVEFTGKIRGQELYVDVDVRRSGYFSELYHRIEILLPKRMKNKMSVDIRRKE